jgi:hypothetical protein
MVGTPPFWEARWLHGATPKELTPNLYKLARFKKRSVFKELQNLNWIRNFLELGNSTVLEEFVLLFMALANVSLSDEKDKITWRWIADGQYTVASTYECQFLGAMVTFPASIL